MTDFLDRRFVETYARSPADSTIKRVASLHTSVRQVLGDAGYLTFLQGSYRNDTALAEVNDVDIVAIVRQPPTKGWLKRPDWGAMFAAVERKLQAPRHYAGKWERGDKCIRLRTGINADIVPAIHGGNPENDPIAIHSFRLAINKVNWPRLHYQNGVLKSAATKNAYKPSVRLFKTWARSHFEDDRRVAPSYFLESLLHSLPERLFSDDLAYSFVGLGTTIVKTHDGYYPRQTLPRVGGDGDLFTGDEWDNPRWQTFLARLKSSLVHARAALGANSERAAKAAWRRTFNGYEW